MHEHFETIGTDFDPIVSDADETCERKGGCKEGNVPRSDFITHIYISMDRSIERSIDRVINRVIGR